MDRRPQQTVIPPVIAPYLTCLNDGILVRFLPPTPAQTEGPEGHICQRCLKNGITQAANRLVNGLPLCRWHDPLPAELPRLEARGRGRVRWTLVDRAERARRSGRLNRKQREALDQLDTGTGTSTDGTITTANDITKDITKEENNG